MRLLLVLISLCLLHAAQCKAVVDDEPAELPYDPETIPKKPELGEPAEPDTCLDCSAESTEAPAPTQSSTDEASAEASDTTEAPTPDAPTAQPSSAPPGSEETSDTTDAPTASPTEAEVAGTPPAEEPSTKPTGTPAAPPAAVDKGRCGPYTADDGTTTYDNRCMTKDRGGQCVQDTSQPHCICTAAWTGTYCSVNPQAFGNLGGNSSEALVDVINVGKSSPARLISSLPALLSFLTDEQRVQMSYTREEMFLEATFEERQLNITESFTLFNDPSLGNCFTFNHFNASSQYDARGPGPRYGLRVALEFQPEEYVPWVEAVGIFTFIHPIGQNIYLESVKHTIQPGNAEEIAMKKHSFTRRHDLFASCVASTEAAQSFYFPGDYSVDGCLRSCYQDSVYRSCNCMDPSYARKQGVNACNFEQLECIDEMSARRGDPYYWPECRCDFPCKEVEYRYETSRAMYLQTLSSNTSRTSEVSIYLATLDVYAQAEEWTFPFSRVLGLTGGFAGVLLGICVVFVVEVLVLIVRVTLIALTNSDPLRTIRNPHEK